MTAAARIDGYADLALSAQATGYLADPWLEGKPRLRAAPVVLPADRKRAIDAAAEAVAAVHDELCHVVAGEPALLDDWFQLTPWQKAMWLAAAPRWHGIARADVFLTADGPRVCELNSDTPSGQPEAVLLNRLLAAAHPRLADCNRALEARFVALVEACAPPAAQRPLSVGIVYPTEITEDLAMIALYRDWLSARGHAVVLGSPYNLSLAADGRAALFDAPCDVVLRHYKTDWWGERLPVWDDEPLVPDPQPLVEPLCTLLEAELAQRTAVVNPFGAVLTQNKRTLAFLHEEIDRFGPASQAAIRRYVPRSWRLEQLPRDEVRRDRERLVLKSDYGCEGAEVVVGSDVSQDEWEGAVGHAIAARWIAQERFVPEASDGEVVNHGVFLIGGVAAGIYARLHAIGERTEAGARSAPVLEEPR